MNKQLTLFKRSILVDGRQLANYLSWLACGVLLFFILTQMNSSSSITGLTYLGVTASINLIVILLTGVVGFSSTITEEKEDDTLGLLMMSGISPINLIFSKSMARIARGIFLTLSQFPFVIIAITLGGIALHQVIAIYITLLAFLIFLAFFCTFFSVIFETTTKAVTAAASALALLAWSTDNHFLYKMSPIYALEQILQLNYQGYWVSSQLIGSLSLGILFFILSIMTFNLFVLNEKHSLPKATSLKKTKTLKYGRSWQQAIFWKDFFYTLGGYRWWLLQGLVLFILTAMFVNDYSYFSWERATESTFISAIIIIIIQLTFIAQSILSKEFKEQTHSCLFTLPLGLGSILKEKLKAAALHVLPTATIVTLGCIKIISAESEALLGTLMIMSILGTHLILTFYLSLKVRLFAFILAAFITILSNILFAFMLSSAGDFSIVAILFIFLNSCIAFIFGNMAAVEIRQKLQA